MGRSRKGGAVRNRKPGEPYGGQWDALRARLWRQWGPDAACYHCAHAITPGLGTVQHLLSPQVRSDLAMTESNLRPCHAGGRRRCPECGLDCQALAASNTAARDPEGRPLPFSAEYIRSAQARRAAAQARNPGEAREISVKAPDTAGKLPGPAPVLAAPAGAVGAEYDPVPGHVVWCCDQPAMAGGRVTDAAPGAGCRALHWHGDGDPGRCW